jgi:hypothetical protein
VHLFARSESSRFGNKNIFHLAFPLLSLTLKRNTKGGILFYFMLFVYLVFGVGVGEEEEGGIS